MPYLDLESILNSLTVEDVIKIMSDLGSSTYKREGNTLILESICHGSSSHKLYYYHDATDRYPARMCHCYSQCSCSYNLIQLVQKIKHCSFYEALSYIAGTTGNMFYSKTDIQPTELIDDFSFIRKFKKKNRQEIPILKELNEHILELFAPYPYVGWLEEGISIAVMQEFEIGYFGRDNAITIPHRDIDGRLVGVRERFIDSIDIEAIGKYVPVMIEGEFLRHALGSSFYGIFQNQNAIRKYKTVILFEGEKSVLLSHSYFGEDDCSLAVCGSNLTPIQIKILLEVLGVETVIICFDKEYKDANSIKADAYRNKIYKKIKPLVSRCNVDVVWDTEGLIEEKDSPIDKGKDTYLHLLNDRKHITIEDLEVLNETKK